MDASSVLDLPQAVQSSAILALLNELLLEIFACAGPATDAIHPFTEAQCLHYSRECTPETPSTRVLQ